VGLMYSKCKIIAAIDMNGLMGYDNKIPWSKPEDMKRFKELTSNHVVIMGRKTYESIGKPLPNRINCVLSRSSNIKNLKSDVLLYSDMVKLLEDLDDYIQNNSQKQVWIIGGSSIYEDAFVLDVVSEVDLTIINGGYIPSATDSLEVSARKSVYFPQIPWVYSVESEYINEKDNSLLHRRYVKSIW
jgi:dihydrofolate reductase